MKHRRLVVPMSSDAINFLLCSFIFLQFYYGFLFSSIHSFIYNSIIHIVNKQLNQKQFQHENPIGCAEEEEKKKTNKQTQISK